MSAVPPIEPFLQDISGASPQGESLRYDDVYEEIKDAQREDEDLPQGVWVQDLKLADWGRVETLCTEVLQKRSKDIQVCSWLVEAWLYRYGLEGLNEGIRLVEELSRKYWDTMYPEIDENGDMGFRFSPYIWINEKLSERLNFIAITNPKDSGETPANFAQYIDCKGYWGSASSSDIPPHKQEKVILFDKSVEQTERGFFEDIREKARLAIEEFNSLEAFVDEKAGDQEAPGFQRFKASLEGLIEFCDQVLGMKEVPKSEEQETESEEADHPVPTLKQEEESDVDLSTVIRNREEAYAVIHKAADYLERLDPHSPAPHMLKRAVAWGKMPLKDLLQEIIKEPQVLSEVQHLLGISGAEEGSSPGEGTTGGAQNWLDPSQKQSENS